MNNTKRVTIQTKKKIMKRNCQLVKLTRKGVVVIFMCTVNAKKMKTTTYAQWKIHLSRLLLSLEFRTAMRGMTVLCGAQHAYFHADFFMHTFSIKKLKIFLFSFLVFEDSYSSTYEYGFSQPATHAICFGILCVGSWLEILIYSGIVAYSLWVIFSFLKKYSRPLLYCFWS